MKWPDWLPVNDENVLFNDSFWYVLDVSHLFEDELLWDSELRFLNSGIAHNCQHFVKDEGDHFQILGSDDSLAGYCWWCKESVPENVQTVWKLHNWDYLSHIRPEAVTHCIEEAKNVLANRKRRRTSMWAVHWDDQYPQES